jgi:dihydrofolate reductase
VTTGVPLALVWAQAANGVIGDHGTLPWHLPEDLARFRALTMGATVVMGRATWNSLPERVRPLPGRRNVVLSRRPGWQAPGALAAGSLRDALDLVEGDGWVIGGASIYAAALPFAKRIEVTLLREPFDGDARAPELDGRWRESRREPAEGWLRSTTGLDYRTLTYLAD